MVEQIDEINKPNFSLVANAMAALCPVVARLIMMRFGQSAHMAALVAIHAAFGGAQ